MVLSKQHIINLIMIFICSLDCELKRANKNVTLYLTWNVIPNVGSLPNVVVAGSQKYAFPDQYTSAASV